MQSQECEIHDSGNHKTLYNYFEFIVLESYKTILEYVYKFIGVLVKPSLFKPSVPIRANQHPRGKIAPDHHIAPLNGKYTVYPEYS